MGFGQPDFPRAAGMFDRSQRAGACAALDLSPVGLAPPRTNFLAFLSNRTVVFAGDSVLGELYVALVRAAGRPAT